MRHPQVKRHDAGIPKKGVDSGVLLCIVIRGDVPRFWGKQTLTISGVIPCWQSHFETVIARQKLGLRFLVLSLSFLCMCLVSIR